MTEISMEERIAIRDSARSLKKYGSISNHYKRPETLIKHEVSSSDTLQGIALKYGVTTESIRRANRLWANDSLFLRKSLLIPLPGDSLTSPSDVVLFESDHQESSSNNNKVTGADSAAHDPSYSDFLVKIDCAIASTKSQVMMTKDHSEFVPQEEESIFAPRKQKTRSKSGVVENGISPDTGGGRGGGSEGGAHALPSVVTQGGRVPSSRQRHQPSTDDDFFEL